MVSEGFVNRFPIYEISKVALLTKFGYNVGIILSVVDVVDLEEVGRVQLQKNLDFIFEERLANWCIDGMEIDDLLYNNFNPGTLMATS